jgi:hypothetical protein
MKCGWVIQCQYYLYPAFGTLYYNSKIIGYRTELNKTAYLVKYAIWPVKWKLKNIQLFLTDGGNKLKNQMIDETLEAI